jgi:hypothetical protein
MMEIAGDAATIIQSWLRRAAAQRVLAVLRREFETAFYGHDFMASEEANWLYFGMHPTAVACQHAVFNGDRYSAVQRKLQNRCLADLFSHPIVQVTIPADIITAAGASAAASSTATNSAKDRGSAMGLRSLFAGTSTGPSSSSSCASSGRGPFEAFQPPLTRDILSRMDYACPPPNVLYPGSSSSGSGSGGGIRGGVQGLPSMLMMLSLPAPPSLNVPVVPVSPGNPHVDSDSGMPSLEFVLQQQAKTGYYGINSSKQTALSGEVIEPSVAAVDAESFVSSLLPSDLDAAPPALGLGLGLGLDTSIGMREENDGSVFICNEEESASAAPAPAGDGNTSGGCSSEDIAQQEKDRGRDTGSALPLRPRRGVVTLADMDRLNKARAQAQAQGQHRSGYRLQPMGIGSDASFTSSSATTAMDLKQHHVQEQDQDLAQAQTMCSSRSRDADEAIASTTAGPRFECMDAVASRMLRFYHHTEVELPTCGAAVTLCGGSSVQLGFSDGEQGDDDDDDDKAEDKDGGDGDIEEGIRLSVNKGPIQTESENGDQDCDSCLPSLECWKFRQHNIGDIYLTDQSGYDATTSGISQQVQEQLVHTELLALVETTDFPWFDSFAQPAAVYSLLANNLH